MLPCVRAADALWDKVFLTGTCVLGGQESKTVFWARNLKPSLPSFVNLCFLLFKITDSRILQTACTVHQCFMFILSVLCCFSSGGELPEFFHWIVCPLTSGVHPVGWSCSAPQDPANLPDRLLSITPCLSEHQCVLLGEISCQDVHYRFQMKMLF